MSTSSTPSGPEATGAGKVSAPAAGRQAQTTGERFQRFVDAAVTRAESTLEIEDPQVLQLSLMLRKVNQLMADDANRQVYQPEGWTHASFRICFGLWVAGPMAPHQIASTSNMSRATVSAGIKKIEEDGLISREPSTVDQRSTVVRLTPAGEEAVLRSYQAHIGLEHHWLTPLADTERLLLIMLLRKLLNGPAAQEGRA